MNDFANSLALLILGWLFGMLSPAIVESIKRERENRLGRNAILNELNEVATTLAQAAYGAKLGLGQIDREFLEWLKNFTQRNSVAPALAKLLPNLQKYLDLTDEQLQNLSAHAASSKDKGLVLQHYPVPLLDSRVAAVWTFETNFQRKLFQIRREIALLDDLVDRSRKYSELTFSVVGSDNHRLVTENIEQTVTNYADRAIRVVNHIEALRSEV